MHNRNQPEEKYIHPPTARSREGNIRYRSPSSGPLTGRRVQRATSAAPVIPSMRGAAQLSKHQLDGVGLLLLLLR
jgi:hypothetical protein